MGQLQNAAHTLSSYYKTALTQTTTLTLTSANKTNSSLAAVWYCRMYFAVVPKKVITLKQIVRGAQNDIKNLRMSNGS